MHFIDNIIVDDPDRLECEIAANVEDVNCNGGNDGSATVMVTGGLTPYAYALRPV